MASIYYRPQQNRWRVSWIRINGKRAWRQFRAEADAAAFVDGLVDERNGRPGPKPEPMTPDVIRVKIHRSVVIDQNGCWIWQPKSGNHGYAQLTRRIDGQVTAFLVHRLSYEAFVGSIPDGLEIDHLCCVTKCVNPTHLEPVTQAENIRRRDARKAVSA